MRALGKVFKQMRESRNISLRQATGGEFSASMLSRFENGQSEISAEKLRQSLSNIYLSVTEFEILVNEHQETEYGRLLEEIQRIRKPFQKEKFLELIKHQEIEAEKGNKIQFYQLNAILLRVILYSEDEAFSVQENDIQVLSDYLFSTEFWGFYELTLFSEVLFLFPSQSILYYSQEMLRRSSYLNQEFYNQNLIHTILINCLFYLSEMGYLDVAKQIKVLLETHFSETRDAYMRIIELIASGYYQTQSGLPTGPKRIKQGLAILDALGYHSQADYYREELKDYL